MNSPTPTNIRARLRSLFDTAVATADPMRQLAKHLPPLNPKGRTLVIGAGKAAARMAQAVERHYAPGSLSGLVITRYGHHLPTHKIEVIEAAHPYPDQQGAAATQRMLALLAGLNAEDTVIALISGGGSALLCAPKPPLTLTDKIAINQALLASGAPIGAINILRKHISCVKGGQLAARAYPASITALMISDVPGDAPGLIASGPTVGLNANGTEGADAALAIRKQYLPSFGYLDTIITADNSAPIAAHDVRLTGVINTVIAAPIQSLEAATAQAETWGVEVDILGDSIEGVAREVAAEHAKRALAKQAERRAAGVEKPLLLLSGGELTVEINNTTAKGVGGPNAEYALAMALALDGAPGIHAMACDTDGVDGAAEVAGAVIDPSTLVRAAARDVRNAEKTTSLQDDAPNNNAHSNTPEQRSDNDEHQKHPQQGCYLSPVDARGKELKKGREAAKRALAGNDAHSFFASLSDQIITGPTHTNVNDFRAIWITST